MLPKDVLFRLDTIGKENSEKPLYHGYYIPLKVQSSQQINTIYKIFECSMIVSDVGVHLSDHRRVDVHKRKKVDRKLKNLGFTAYSSTVNVTSIPLSMTPGVERDYAKFIRTIKERIIEMSIWHTKSIWASLDEDYGKIDKLKLGICGVINKELLNDYSNFRKDEFFYNEVPLISNTMEVVNDIVRIVKIEGMYWKRGIKELVQKVLDLVIKDDELFYMKRTKECCFKKNKYDALLVRKQD